MRTAGTFTPRQSNAIPRVLWQCCTKPSISYRCFSILDALKTVISATLASFELRESSTQCSCLCMHHQMILRPETVSENLLHRYHGSWKNHRTRRLHLQVTESLPCLRVLEFVIGKYTLSLNRYLKKSSQHSSMSIHGEFITQLKDEDEEVAVLSRRGVR